ncbi:MAG TPA: isopentenyl-diphosphate delta-isomerase, partial [Saprospiraceae bacterium]|nr:isopentenyl-diphosphate delta-isomerase [Saprospiraceae bacterium]
LCADLRMGMGLGSCRQLLYSREHLADFDVREVLGPDLPLYANLGVAQVEQLIDSGEAADRIPALLDLLRADGLIVHVNPLQEAMQPEGDRFRQSPLATLERLLALLPIRLIVKEVGQGMGPASLRALLQLPLEAIEFAAAGGTNFARLELLRASPAKQEVFGKIAAVGHTAVEMLDFVREARAELGERCQVRHLILSGGVEDFLDGYYLLSKSPLPAVYGQASAFLRHARGEYHDLYAYASAQLRGLELAQAFLRARW